MMHKIKIQRGNLAGFTLVEVMVVLVVIAILGGISVPGYMKWMPGVRLKSAARDLYTNMQKTRMGAVKDNKDWAIQFDPGNNSYTIYSDSGDDDWTTTGDNVAVETVRLPGYQYGVAFGHGTAAKQATGDSFPDPYDDVSYTAERVVFNPLGTGDAGYVYLENQDQAATYAVGTRSSGALRILKWAGGGWE